MFPDAMLDFVDMMVGAELAKRLTRHADDPSMDEAHLHRFAKELRYSTPQNRSTIPGRIQGCHVPCFSTNVSRRLGREANRRRNSYCPARNKETQVWALGRSCGGHGNDSTGWNTRSCIGPRGREHLFRPCPLMHIRWMGAVEICARPPVRPTL